MGTLTGDTPSLPEHCHHKLATSCRLTATSKCCACQDLRPHKAAYSTYVDGLGMVERGTRWQRYCWFCKTFWENRVKVSGMEARMTKVPEDPDQSTFVEQWFDYHRGCRVEEGESGSPHNIVPLRLERPWRDVAPGFLPTLDQPDVSPVITVANDTSQTTHVSLESTLDSLMDSIEDDEEAEVTQVIRQEPTHAMANAAVRRLPSRPPALAPARERIDAARSELAVAQDRRRALRLELTNTERSLAEFQRNLAELTRAQHTARNMERVFGTRDEVQSQGAGYVSPLASMFSRAYDRYDTAEEVRAAERASDANRADRLARLADFIRSTEDLIERRSRGSVEQTNADQGPSSLDDERIKRPPPKTEAEMQVSLTCKVCLQQIADIAVLPCGHLVMCSYCSQIALPTREEDHTRPRSRIAGCPLCKKKVKQVVRIYTS